MHNAIANAFCCFFAKMNWKWNEMIRMWRWNLNNKINMTISYQWWWSVVHALCIFFHWDVSINCCLRSNLIVVCWIRVCNRHICDMLINSIYSHNYLIALTAIDVIKATKEEKKQRQKQFIYNIIFALFAIFFCLCKCLQCSVCTFLKFSSLPSEQFTFMHLIANVNM